MRPRSDSLRREARSAGSSTQSCRIGCFRVSGSSGPCGRVRLSPLSFQKILPLTSVCTIVGFLTIALVAIAALTVNSRLPPRKISNIFDFSPLRERSFALFVAGECLIMLGLYVPYFYIQDYGLAHGVSPNVTEYSLAILNGASVFGRILPNWLADTWGPLTILTPHCYLSGICMFLFIPMCKSEAGLIVFAVLFGFASGAFGCCLRSNLTPRACIDPA